MVDQGTTGQRRGVPGGARLRLLLLPARLPPPRGKAQAQGDGQPLTGATQGVVGRRAGGSSRQQRAMGDMTAFMEEYASALRALDTADKAQINMLTMLAEDNKFQALTLVDVIARHTLLVRSVVCCMHLT